VFLASPRVHSHVPLLFLSDTDLERYATFPKTLNAEELNRHFVLGPQDLALVLERRRDYNRLGFAVQLCTLRALGTFLESPFEVPDVVLRTLARQMGMGVPRDLKRYARREMTLYEHQKLILDYLGYGMFDKFETFRITRWMYRKFLVGDARPLELFEEAIIKLRDRKVALPAASTLARLVVRVRERASQKAELAISRRLSPEQVLSLESLLLVPEGERKSNLDLLRRAPVRPSAPSLITALERIEKLRALKLDGVDLSDLPYGRIKMMSRQGMTVWAYTISQWGPLKRHATLLATVQHLLGRSLSDVLDVFERLMHQLGLNGHYRWQKERLRNLKDLDESAGLLGKAMKLLLEYTKKRPIARDKVLEQFGEAKLKEAVLQVEKLTTGADVRDSEVWLSAQNSVWNFFSRFIKVVAFEGTPVNAGLLEAVTFLQSESWRVLDWEKAPRGFVPRSWKTLVYDKSTGLNAKTYVLCVAQQLYLALKARAVYAPLSLRHQNPRAGLLEGEVWEAKRVEVARNLNMPLQAKPELERLETALDGQYLQTLATLSTNTVLKMEKTSSGLQPILTPLEALETSLSLRHLQTEVTRRMPKIDLSELVLEVNAYTGFAREFIVLNDRKNAPTEDPDLELSVCAVLVAQACNISLSSVVKPDVPALTLKRLMHVQQNYIRNDTLMRANAKLVEAHAGLPIVRHWGQGEADRPARCRFVQDSGQCGWFEIRSSSPKSAPRT